MSTLTSTVLIRPRLHTAAVESGNYCTKNALVEKLLRWKSVSENHPALIVAWRPRRHHPRRL